jgi:hypothetical protein
MSKTCKFFEIGLFNRVSSNYLYVHRTFAAVHFMLCLPPDLHNNEQSNTKSTFTDAGKSTATTQKLDR